MPKICLLINTEKLKTLTNLNFWATSIRTPFLEKKLSCRLAPGAETDWRELGLSHISIQTYLLDLFPRGCSGSLKFVVSWKWNRTILIGANLFYPELKHFFYLTISRWIRLTIFGLCFILLQKENITTFFISLVWWK